MALSIAIGYIMHKLTESAEEASVSLPTSVELILQAQQAMMAATIAAMVAIILGSKLVRTYVGIKKIV